MFILRFLNDQLLKMQWLHELVWSLVENVFGLDVSTRLGGSIHFFIYDIIKIFILLTVLIYLVSYIQSYFPPERTRAILGRFRGITGNTLGALLGTITPFCSCSSIPLFIGFTSAGLPLGVTFSFLLSSPFVDLASMILLASIFNWKIAIVYVVVGVLLAIVGGTIISKMQLEQYVAPFVFHQEISDFEKETTMTRRERMAYAWDQVTDIVKRIWIYIVIGVAIGAAIHNWIPAEMISALLGQDKWYSVLLATAIGIPMYADIFGALPIAEALVYKGVGVGTVLGFMMAVTAISPPSLIMLNQVVKSRLMAVFVTVVIVGIIIIGYVLNGFNAWLL
ncbi:MAG: permease [Syntrophomonadaceae bacterium]|nr:permease [Syntrophomonadaceae bacterium]